ncbi:hypothetical protein [Halobacillus halophilus]|uniref:hypothetical protein n=1 Tax=Halobacillus halophilus TaxID=1570 RepID=UPI001CD39CD5|nr:hypothetical protein [Halobacillus halophilus]MCA1011402.1 hypothetical protein [Halobacillus halophilus]
MLVYMIYDKSSGEIVHMHRNVDIHGRSYTCTEEEIHRMIPPHIDRKSVGYISTELDQPPSGRQVKMSVDLTKNALIKTFIDKDAPIEKNE